MILLECFLPPWSALLDVELELSSPMMEARQFPVVELWYLYGVNFHPPFLCPGCSWSSSLSVSLSFFLDLRGLSELSDDELEELEELEELLSLLSGSSSSLDLRFFLIEVVFLSSNCFTLRRMVTTK